MLAKQKILSIFQHCSNVHHFPAFTRFQQCQHGVIDGDHPWIKQGKLIAKLSKAKAPVVLSFSLIATLGSILDSQLS